MTKNQFAGYIFERIVRKLLLLNFYSDYKSREKFQGRGAKHQIDACGIYNFSTPFVNQIRLLAEVKCHVNGNIELFEIRNFYGAWKDISENYFINGKINPEHRFTDCACMFSATGFDESVYNYAYAHNIYLVDYKNYPLLKPVIDEILKFVAENDISNYDIKWTEEEGNMNRFYDLIGNIKTSILGLAMGHMPLHIVSEQKFPEFPFAENDTQNVEISYRGEEIPEEMDLKLNEWTGHFRIPKEMYSWLFNHPTLNKIDILRAKEQFLGYIDIPIYFNEGKIKRIIKLKINEPWLKQAKTKIYENKKVSSGTSLKEGGIMASLYELETSVYGIPRNSVMHIDLDTFSLEYGDWTLFFGIPIDKWESFQGHILSNSLDKWLNWEEMMYSIPRSFELAKETKDVYYIQLLSAVVNLSELIHPDKLDNMIPEEFENIYYGKYVKCHLPLDKKIIYIPSSLAQKDTKIDILYRKKLLHKYIIKNGIGQTIFECFYVPYNMVSVQLTDLDDALALWDIITKEMRNNYK